MSKKEIYITLFKYIKETLTSNKIMPNTQVPEFITKNFDYNFNFEFIEGEKQPNFIFEIKDLHNNSQIKLIFCITQILNSTKFENYRKTILKDNFSGILITKKNFFKTTSIPFGIIVFTAESENKYFSTIDNEEDLYNVIFDKKNHKRSIFFPEIIDYKNLLPEHYNPQNLKISRFIETFCPKKLEDIADIIPGKIPASWEINETEGIPLLNNGSIKNGKIVKFTKFVNEDAVSNYSRQLLEDGDILISRTFTFGQDKLCVVKEKDLPAIASGFLIIIRPLNITNINLYDYLSSNTGELIFKKQLSDITTGSVLQNISISSLKNIQIPSINKRNIDTFEKEYNSTFEEIKNIAKSALNRISESILEEQTLENLAKAGWKSEDISRTERIKYNNHFLIPDITLKDNGSILAFIEVKQSSLNINDKIAQIKAIQKQHNALAIISLGDYFEVYKKVKEQFIVYKFASAPTKNDLMKIIKEEN